MKGNYTSLGTYSGINAGGNGKMSLGKSIKMYLTIFILTTCIYMALYQYHISREPFAASEVVKHQEKSSSYIASYLWSPISLLMANSSSNTINNSITTTTTTTTSTTTAPTATTTRTAGQKLTASASIRMVSLAATIPTLISSSSDLRSGSLGGHPQKTATTKTTTTTTTTTTTASGLATATSTRTTTTAKTSAKTPAATTPTAGHMENAHKTRPTFVAASVPPPLYIITPTYRRPEQMAELTRLGYTLKHVVNLLWLVIEDANITNPLVSHTLDRIGVPYEYMLAPMPEKYKQTKKAKPRGVSNRNRGLEYLRQHATEGVLYFADDDNTYDISIFEQMRYITKVAMWPVGLVTKTGVSSPIIQEGKLVGFYDGWIGGRKYPVDMAGFAVNVKFLKERPNAQMPFKPGYEEDGFLRSLAPLDNKEIELLADDCRDVLTWHTQTKKNAPAQELNRTRYKNTNLEYIDKLLVRP
ncbi:galactosylgalactosylxylosylprotein 3-beta-glucuronosyltransferase P isoform X1 [Drosophila eugracilis]|uniref:galactosylgalactosylxylosylprotein 3-beta-glucuronosyltransferase P isoform X1 n=1 Tax=Drosophila eugracilis TaxID=29029 RepID=UPI0007E74BD8|nr:galactosylgalactosylxylosylprotein 3-beta-glucuronosyltransferase P isoform X1 [Drosophila eugracilis]XP_017081065.1 galactosylgalactosylxylosylprotein 3-beta-glucuronosyltransferase P isoform X1 [Drosophila eugracilis]XP_017081066.1 galactosylgalactosylxylosylprotein 3-beta-glucuronosyltransferase P isoform X1 [Drosophila eugracilis]XP_017081067.1 galactosylgalactosylxylosylprotein 3-beta-glucuronosyltransferase P isoform X1 [Drosophila eugracilis]XP_017081068.1 galactosylgalactosylxylosylp